MAQLHARYGEVVIGQGVTFNGGVLEIFANPESGTFSAVLSMPQGMGGVSCIVSAGKDWEIFAPEPPGSPA